MRCHLIVVFIHISLRMLSIFSRAFWPFVCLPWRDVSSSPFEFFLLLSWKSSLCVVNTRLFSDTWLAKNFFPFFWFSCHFLYNVLRCTKFLILKKSHSSFVAPAFGVISENPLLNPRSWSPMFSSKSFNVKTLYLGCWHINTLISFYLMV